MNMNTKRDGKNTTSNYTPGTARLPKTQEIKLHSEDGN